MSGDILARRDAVLPGGTINDFRLPAGHDVIVERAEGVRVWDVTGRSYQDHLIGSGPLVLGHAHPAVVEAISRQALRGTTYYAPNLPAIELAEAIVGFMPGIEQVRYCSDGSDAVFYALRIARAVTGRDLVLKFEGGFHGHSDYAMQSFAPAVSGPFPSGQPDSGGIPASVGSTVLVAPYNDIDAVTAILAEHGDRVAAILVEPVQRAIEPRPGFLPALRELADRHGCLLVADEIVTGFRLDMGGAQAKYGFRADLTTLGKSMSGGLPFACVGGPASVMRTTAGGIYMSGTLNGNPLGAAAGLATIRVMEEIDGCARIERAGGRLKDGLVKLLADSGLPGCVIGPAAFPEVVFGPAEVHDYAAYARRDTAAATRFGLGLLDRGFLVKPGTKIYQSALHTDAEIDALLDACAESLAAVEAAV